MSIKQHVLTAACMAALMGGCAVAAPPATKNHGQAGLQRVWMLTDLSGIERDRLVPLQAKMDLTALPQAVANMGCNHLNFEVQPQDNGQIRFGPLMSTRMYCAGRMDAEQQFGQRIGQMKHYRLEGQRLILRNDAGEEMRFVAQDWD